MFSIFLGQLTQLRIDLFQLSCHLFRMLFYSYQPLRKLALVLRGLAQDSILDSYESERIPNLKQVHVLADDLLALLFPDLVAVFEYYNSKSKTHQPNAF